MFSAQTTLKKEEKERKEEREKGKRKRKMEGREGREKETLRPVARPCGRPPSCRFYLRVYSPLLDLPLV